MKENLTIELGTYLEMKSKLHVLESLVLRAEEDRNKPAEVLKSINAMLQTLDELKAKFDQLEAVPS